MIQLHLSSLPRAMQAMRRINDAVDKILHLPLAALPFVLNSAKR